MMDYDNIKCPKCGSTKRPNVKQVSYIITAVCPDCGHEELT